VKLLADQPELQDAAGRLVRGDCRQALPLLTVYVGQHEKSALSEYLLARAWICSDEFVKGAHHLALAWNHSDELHEEIRLVAREAGARLSELYSKGQAGTFAHLRALALLYQYGAEDWYSAAAEQALADYAVRLAQRGDHVRQVDVAAIMRRVGVPIEKTFPLEAGALVRLGETERLRAAADALEKAGPEGTAGLLHAAGSEAEASFHAAEAVELFERCGRQAGAPATLELDLVRVLLKAGRPDDAVTRARAWLSGSPGDAERAVAIADLYLRFDRFEDAFGVLEEGRRVSPKDFRFYRALTGLSRKLPDRVKASEVLAGYLAEEAGTPEAVTMVGELCLEWKLSAECAQVLKGVRGDSTGLPDYYLAALEWVAGNRTEATKLFDRLTSDKSGNPAALLDRVARFLVSQGSRPEAIRYLERAVARDGSNVDALLQLATLLEDQEPGRGLALVKPEGSRQLDKAAQCLAVARWCHEKGGLKAAAQWARRALDAASTLERSDAALALGGYLWDSLDSKGAFQAWHVGIAEGMDKVPPLEQLLKRASAQAGTELSCFALDELSAAVPGEIPVVLLEGAVVASLRCRRPDVGLMARYVFSHEDPEGAYLRLLSFSGDPVLDAAFLELEGRKGQRVFRSSELTGRLCELFAAAQQPQRALEYARQHAGAVGTDGTGLADLGRRVLFLGSPAAALEILRAANERPGTEARGEVGLLLASLLLSQGRQDEGIRVLDDLLAREDSAPLVPAAAVLLIDLGRPDAAERVCAEALGHSGRRGKTPKAKIEEGKDSEGEGPLSKARLLAMLGDALDDAEPDSRELLLGLFAHAWLAQGKSADKLAERVLELVESWHGEHLAGALLLRLAAVDQGLELFRDAFERAPGDFDLFAGLVDALALTAFLDGESKDAVAGTLRKLADRFLAARERDADAHRLAAGRLAQKGFSSIGADLLDELVKSSADERSLLELARELASAGRFDDGLAAFRRAVQASGCGIEALEAWVEDCLRFGRADLALAPVEECSVRYPRDAGIHLLAARTGFAGSDVRRVDAAVEHVKKAVALNEALSTEALGVLVRADQEEEAQRLVEQLVKSKDRQQVLEGLEQGFALAARAGDVERMTRLGAQATRLNRKDASLVSEIAGLYFRYNLVPQGIEKLKSVADSGDDYVSLLLGVRLLASGQRDAGLARLRKYNEARWMGLPKQNGDMPDEQYGPLKIQLQFLDDLDLDAESAALAVAALTVFPDDVRIRFRRVEGLVRGSGVESLEAELGELCRLGLEPQVEEKQWRALVHSAAGRGQVGQLAGLLEQNGGAVPGSPCFAMFAYATALDGNVGHLGQLARQAVDSRQIPLAGAVQAGRLLLDVGQYGVSELLLVHALSLSWGDPVRLGEIHRALCRLHSATGRRDGIREVNRSVLLQSGADREVRLQIARNLVDYEYNQEALEQLELLHRTLGDDLASAQLMFDLLLRLGREDDARMLAVRAAYRQGSLVNGLITFGGLARERMVFDLALDLYGAALVADPTNLALRFNTAELALVAERTDRALELFRSYRESAGSREDGGSEVVQNLGKYDRLGLAASLARKLRTGDALANAAVHHLRAGRADEGARLLDEALSVAKDRAGLTTGVLLYFLGRPALFPKELRLRLEQEECTRGRTAVCAHYQAVEKVLAGDAAAALPMFEAQIVGSGETWAFVLAGMRILAAAGHADLADKLLESTMLGYSRDQVLGEALKSLSAMLEEDRPSASAREATVALMARYAGQLLSADPYDFWNRTLLAEGELNAGRNDEARKMYEQFLEQTPWDPGLGNNLAYLMAKQNTDSDRALQMVRRSIASEPSHSPFYLDTEGWLLYRKGEIGPALEKVQAAVRRTHLGFGDSLAESLYHLGVLQDAAGDREGAVRTLRQGSFLDPYGEFGTLCRTLLLQWGLDPYRLDEKADW
jgi:tetratricopeptide (TPR) repeat protein